MMMITNSFENQQGLNEVVTRKVQSMIERKNPMVLDTIKKLDDENSIAQDFIAPIGVNLKKADKTPVVTFYGNGSLLMNFNQSQFSLHDNAVGQLAEKFSIPTRYLRDLASGDEWKRKLAAEILNEHSLWTDRNRVLVRCVGDQVRGVLSDSYRRINSAEIITSFVREATNMGAVPCDALLTDVKVWIETILPIPITIPTIKNGDIVMFVGARFSTSDYGAGAVDLRTFLLNGACLNGMVRESVINQKHLGARLPDDIQLSQRTYDLDTKATSSAVRDITKSLFSRESIMRKAIEIQGAAEIDVDMDSELKKLVSKGSLMKEESQGIEKLLMKNSYEDGIQGESTLWKLTQAITAQARELTPNRQRDLAEISGELLNRVKLN